MGKDKKEKKKEKKALKKEKKKAKKAAQSSDDSSSDDGAPKPMAKNIPPGLPGGGTFLGQYFGKEQTKGKWQPDDPESDDSDSESDKDDGHHFTLFPKKAGQSQKEAFREGFAEMFGEHTARNKKDREKERKRKEAEEKQPVFGLEMMQKSGKEAIPEHLQRSERKVGVSMPDRGGKGNGKGVRSEWEERRLKRMREMERGTDMSVPLQIRQERHQKEGKNKAFEESEMRMRGRNKNKNKKGEYVNLFDRNKTIIEEQNKKQTDGKLVNKIPEREGGLSLQQIVRMHDDSASEDERIAIEEKNSDSDEAMLKAAGAAAGRRNNNDDDDMAMLMAAGAAAANSRNDSDNEAMLKAAGAANSRSQQQWKRDSQPQDRTSSWRDRVSKGKGKDQGSSWRDRMQRSRSNERNPPSWREKREEKEGWKRKESSPPRTNTGSQEKVPSPERRTFAFRDKNKRSPPKDAKAPEPVVAKPPAPSEDLSGLDANELAAKAMEAMLSGDMDRYNKLNALASQSKMEPELKRKGKGGEQKVLEEIDSKGRSIEMMEKVRRAKLQGQSNKLLKEGNAMVWTKDGAKQYFSDDTCTLEELRIREAIEGVQDIDRNKADTIMRMGTKYRELEDDENPEEHLGHYEKMNKHLIKKRGKAPVDLDARARKKQVADANRLRNTMDKCNRCMEAGAFNKRKEVISQSNQVYLCFELGNKIVVEGQMLIIPKEHVQSVVSMEEDVAAEIREYQKSICRALDRQNLAPVFIEEVFTLTKQFEGSGQHTVIQVIPIPKEKIPDAIAFVHRGFEEAEMWTTHKKVIQCPKGHVRGAIPPGFTYVHIEIGMEKGLAHQVEDKTNFHTKGGYGLSLFHNLLEIDVLTRAYTSTQAAEMAKEKFSALFKQYDWSVDE